MSQDGHYSSVHFTNYNQVLHLEEWKDYHIPYNDIDTSRLFEETASIFPQFLLEEDEDGGIPLNSSIFGAKVYKNRSLLKTRVWTDLGLEHLRPDAAARKLPDNTILRALRPPAASDEPSISDFLANGYHSEASFNPDVSNVSGDEIWLNTTSEYLANHTFSNMKVRSNSGSFPSAHHQTPRIAKTRQLSQEKVQTPISRIMR